MSLTQIFGESPLEKKLTMDKPVESRLDTTDSKLVGKPLSRIEGHLKVAGKATYTAEHQFDDLCHGVMVGATIGKGKVKKVHKDTALQVAGVIGVFHDPLFLRNPQQGGVKMARGKRGFLSWTADCLGGRRNPRSGSRRREGVTD